MRKEEEVLNKKMKAMEETDKDIQEDDMFSLLLFNRFLPIDLNKRMQETEKDTQASLKGIINKREKAMEAGEAASDDLLAILLESNHMETEEHENNKNGGMSIDLHPNWQARARNEVLQVFGNQKPDFDGLSHLKIMTIILYEALRLGQEGIGMNFMPHH
ncbi:Cytochrome P450 family protein [Quillaja saponaria]|uniref:Cytochrome P450 family protein n=1 Tax=Quillaja saponaria TaxID=32244 RepID=A0AAD7KZS0_QUISA|nr:Cytochrome P450 family protein [Quillaja saponaria]